MCTGVEYIVKCMMCLYLGGGSLLHVDVCCKSLASQMLLNGSINMEITELHSAVRLETGNGAIF